MKITQVVEKFEYDNKMEGIAKCYEIYQQAKELTGFKILADIDEVVREILNLQPGEGIEYILEGDCTDGITRQVIVDIQLPKDYKSVSLREVWLNAGM